MKQEILVLNSGSSSIKFQLFRMPSEEVLARGSIERIGEPEATLHYQRRRDRAERKLNCPVADHATGLERIVALLTDPELGVIATADEVGAVGHRVVHGGERFHESILIDEEVLAAIRACVPLAPLHNPANLSGIEVAQRLLPGAQQVAVFDTAFHQTMPARAYRYALPEDFYREHGVRRYGFHGTSHAFVAKAAAEYLERPLEQLNLVTVHLGNGASIAAVSGGRCIDTSMGLTPLEGLVMGTRCGDIDPSIPFYIARRTGLSYDEIERRLNRESGLVGLCGDNDMRDIERLAEAGEEAAQLAIQVFAYRIRKYIGAYAAALGSLNAVVFTAGIGENSPAMRRAIIGEGFLGLSLDPARNKSGDGAREIHSGESQVSLLVVPTNEELEIAREVTKLL